VGCDICAVAPLQEKHSLQNKLTQWDEWHVLLANVPAVLFRLDCNAIFTQVEGGGLRLLGVDAATLMGRSVFEICGDDTPAAADIRRAFAGQVCVGMMVLGHGLLDTAYAPLRATDGSVIGLVGIALDVSERLV
jgi:PAS domain-containing protein